MLQPPPLSLYVHLPWCVRKCPYCDFNSHAAPKHIPQARYIDALLEDLDLDRKLVGTRPIVSVFFGGGTPSLFDPDEVGRFLAGVRARTTLLDAAEITLEANPGTIEHGRFAGYRAAGVTRVSLGAQSFNDAHLRVLGRIHASEEIARAVDELARAGIEELNIDLMYGLPAQTVEEAVTDVQAAVALSPTHISHYQLTLEPGTVFYHRPPDLPDDETTWAMQQRCQAFLAQRGYEQYEISAYARASHRCQHNLNYWRFGDYLGLGAGAHGKLTLCETKQIQRTARARQPSEYLHRAAAERVQDCRTVSAEELPFEFMLNSLRLIEGFDIAQFESSTGLPFETISATVADAMRSGLLRREGTRWRPSDLGLRFLNDLQCLFLAPAGTSTAAEVTGARTESNASW